VDNSREERQVRFGEAVQQLRLARKQSIKAAAEQAQVSHVTWTRVENGQGVYNRTLVRLDEYLGVKVGTLSRALENENAFDTLLDQIEKAIELVEVSTQQNVPEPENERELESFLDLDSGPSNDRHRSLLDRIEGLEVEELRRLRDMIDAAIFVHERPRVEQARSEAAERAAHARAAATYLEHEFDDLERRRAQGEAIDEEEVYRLRSRIRSAQNNYNVAQTEFIHLHTMISRGRRGSSGEFEDIVSRYGER
jgi:transcriptional regulator with XRE-family HTH domain